MTMTNGENSDHFSQNQKKISYLTRDGYHVPGHIQWANGPMDSFIVQALPRRMQRYTAIVLADFRDVPV
ncbi:MAG: hypothetical protein PHE53_07175 [Thermoguttaceae bacterium]|nr:hypothetical protein [Thermoguttaceae bacterium]